jgi:hypothetical protein
MSIGKPLDHNPFGNDSERDSPVGFSIYQPNDGTVPPSPSQPSIFATPFRTLPQSKTNKLPILHLLNTPESSKTDNAFMDMTTYMSPRHPNLYAMFVDDTRTASPRPHPFYLDRHAPSKATGTAKDQLRSPASPSNYQDPGDPPDELSSADESSPAKQQKGLKLLSVSVRDIVSERQSTTYKEVADAILADLAYQASPGSLRKGHQSREEQNIKRRVYDALNVLISAGVLVKDGKRVRKNDVSPRNKISHKRTEINSINAKLVI